MSDLKIQGVVEMSSEGAERAFDRVGQKSEQMAQKVTQTSAQAGQAVDQIGTGANRNADEFTRAEGRIVSSIKRATTELQNLGKTASQRLELRIDTQGLDRAKFEPLLANLRELEAAQNRVAGSGRSFAGGLQNTSYQLQDFIVQVNGGTDATRALAMQLPQMLIGFGAVGAGIGVVAALLPNLVSLFSDSAGGAKSLDDAMSGLSDAVGAVGQTVKSFDMTGLYEQFNAANDVTRQAIIEQAKFQQALIETEKLVARKSFGESVDGLGEYSFWDKVKFGAVDAATMRASTDPVPIRDDAALQAAKLADQLGVTKQVAAELVPVLRGLEEGSVDVGTAFNQFGTKLLAGNKESVALAKSMRDLARGELDAAAASKAVEEALERMAKGYVTIEKAGAGAARSSRAAADGAERLAEASRELVQSLLGQSSGLSADFFKKWNLLGAAYKTGAISLQDLTDAQGALLAQQPAMKQAAKDAEDYGKALASTVGALEARAIALESELSTYGLTKSQIERTTIARLEEVRAMAAANGATEGYLATLDREIAARKRIAEATAGVEAAEANRKAADDAAKEWQRTADNIEKALVDALMEGGKSGKEYIEGLFRTMVLRPIVQAIVQPVAGSITSAMGFGAPGQGTLGSITGAINGVSNLSSLYGAVTGGMTASLGSLAASAGSMFGSSALSAFGAGMQGSTLAAGLAGPTTAGASGAMGLGSMAGAALPWVAGAFGIASLLGAFDKKPSDKTSAATLDIGSGRVTDVWDMGGKKAASQEQKDANTALSQLAGSFARQAGLTGQLVTAMGSRDGYRLAIEGGFDTPQGRAAGGSWLGGKETAYSYGGDAESALRAMLDDLVDEGTLPQATIAAWRSIKTDMLGAARDATELVSTLNLLVAGYDTATIERANLLQAESEALEVALGRMLQIEAALTDTALPGDALAASAAEMARRLEALALGSVPTTNKALGELVNGLDLTTDEGRKTYQSLMALAPAFVEIQAAQKALYDQLYTDEQRAANLAVEVGDAFAQLGLTLPTTRDEMRALIDAQDGTTEAGAKLKAQLLGLVPAFVSVSDAAGRAVDAASLERKDRLAAQRAQEKQAAEALQKQIEAYAEGAEQFNALRDSLLKAGDAAGLLAAVTERAFADPSGKYMNGKYELPRWESTDTAASFNYKYGEMQARMRQQLGDEASANALRIENVAGVLGAYSVEQMMSEYDPVTGALKLAIQQGIVDASGDLGNAVRDAVQGAALYAAMADVRGQFTSSGPGLASIAAARATAADASRTSIDPATGLYRIGGAAVEYGKAIDSLQASMRSGAIDADTFERAVEALGAALPDAAESIGTLEDAISAAQGAAYAVGNAGLASIRYYFGSLSELTAEFAKAAAEAQEPIAQTTAAIGRLNSAQYAFAGSASATLQGFGGAGVGGAWMLQDAGVMKDVTRAQLIAEAAGIASAAMTTADAAAAAAKLAQSPAFAELTAQGIRDAALLLDGVGEYNAEGFERAFIRISDALAKGSVTEGQYKALFDTALDMFQGVPEETRALIDSMTLLRDAMSGFADGLLIDEQRTTLTAGATLAEMQRQYAQAFAGASTGDSEAISKYQKLATTLLDKDLYSTQAEYNAAFGSVYGDARQLEVIGVNTLANAQGDAMVSELKDMNAKLNKRVEDLEKNLLAALAQIAKNTSDTSRGIEQQIVMAEDTP